MTKINVLDERTISKIAAGEVIERPASVVKELLENSLDAGASSITIDIEDYGKRLIHVADNGSGMDEEDCRLSILRHATSKIKASHDLYSISTLGFRGEALASIAAVSSLTIKSRQKQSVQGYSVEVAGGDVKFSGPVGCPDGTIIDVKNLFFNTPARMKFMKSDTNELKAIADIVSRYALYYSNISFKLTHNGHVLISTNSSDLENAIASIYGPKIAKEMIPLNSENVFGMISKPSLLKSDKSLQSIFVNGRYVKDDIISKAVYEAYHTLLFLDKNPVFVLSLRLDPEKLDVNVHPTKEKVKFGNNAEVYSLVFDSVRNTLLNANLVKSYEMKEAQQGLTTMQVFTAVQTMAQKPAANPYLEKTEQAFFREREIASKGEILKSRVSTYKLLGCVNKTFFLAETVDGFFIIDQHVVEERINYERFMNEFMGKSIRKQDLLKPEIIELPPAEASWLIENIDFAAELGFELSHFGERSFIVRSIPMIFGRIQLANLLSDMVSSASENKNNPINEKQESIITMMSCRASIKAGDECSISKMESLLEELDRCKLPWTCPHGRPIMIKMSLLEIEKMFKRK